MKIKTRAPLGQLLVEKKIITPEQLDAALREQKKTKELLGVSLVRLGFISEEMIYLPILAEHFGVDLVNFKAIEITKEAIEKIPAKFAYHYKVMPVSYQGGTLTIALTKPLDIHTLDDVGLVAQCRLKSVLASEKDIMEAIRKYYGVGAETIEQMMDEAEPQKKSGPVIENVEEIGSEASIAKFLNQILHEAYKDRATDIHIEPFEDELRIRYRIDGILYDAKVPANIKHFKDSINSRIKIMSNLNIAERRLPQDGRFKVRVGDADLDLRVSFLPAAYGESVVIRLLTSAKLYSLEDLGLSTRELSVLDGLIKKPHGIIFVTGPTGSGKTTTLYSCLSRVNTLERKIITIEDPIEYQLKGVTQIQVNPAIGLTFAAGLRSMLRHDPDIMMVGEVRDFETAQIAIQVALTGHLIFSTLHTNDAASAVTRLVDMGIEPYLVSSSVECFIAQRLVRVICEKCKEEAKITSDIAKEFGLSSDEASRTMIYAGKGCEACKFTGYYGRRGIHEFLVVTDAIRDMVVARKTAGQIKAKAIEQGMATLRQSGWEKVKAGLTTPGEVIRVTQEETG